MRFRFLEPGEGITFDRTRRPVRSVEPIEEHIGDLAEPVPLLEETQPEVIVLGPGRIGVASAASSTSRRSIAVGFGRGLSMKRSAAIASGETTPLTQLS